MGVQRRLNQYRNLMGGRECVVLSVDQAQDISALIRQIPENTVILFSSNSASGVTPFPLATPSSSVTSFSSVTPVAGKTPVEYFTDHEIILKNGQDMIGAADDGFEIVIRNRPGFAHRHLIRVGTAKHFQSIHARSSTIKHLTFRPALNGQPSPIDAIVFAECYNRELIVEKNVFHLSAPVAVHLECREPLDASATDWLWGPNLQFANNRIIGKKYNTMIDKRSTEVIPNHGMLIHLPGIENQSGQLSVIGNTFEGSMAQAGEFRLAAGSHIKVFNNMIDISNVGSTTHEFVRKGGFVLEGPTTTAKTFPVFFLAGNQVHVTQTAIALRGLIGLTLACNHLQADHPWWQPTIQLSLKALPVPLRSATELCGGAVSTAVAMSTPVPFANSRFANTWTAVNSSPATACSGLVNIEGQLFFDTEVCQSVAPFVTDNSTTVSPTSSAGTAGVTTLLGVMITLTLLLNW